MARADLFTGIVKLSEKQYLELLSTGYVTVGDKTVFYDKNTLYVTDTNTGVTPLLQIVDSISNTEDLKKIVKLTDEQYISLKNNGHIKVGDDIIVYSPLDTIYVTNEPEKESEITNIVIDVPETAIQGTLSQKELSVLLDNNNNYIIFNNEIYRLNDKKGDLGYLTYSHIGADATNVFFIKCITLTLSTRGWALTIKEI